MRSLIALIALAAVANAEPALNMTALVGKYGKSTFECWAIGPFKSSAQPGTVGALKLELGDLANASYSIIPPNFDAGLHNAPNVQYVQFLSGVAHITLPNSTDSAWVVGGPHGLLFAADVTAVSKLGHSTAYPTGEYTRALQIPTKNGKIPQHKVLHRGPCVAAEVS